jgi:hypothetical protein
MLQELNEDMTGNYSGCEGRVLKTRQNSFQRGRLLILAATKRFLRAGQMSGNLSGINGELS